MNNNPLIVYSPNFWEGTIGILAGKLAENIRFHVWYLQSLLQKESQKDLDVLMVIYT